MRTAFINSLIECSRENKNIWLLTADLGFSVLEKFREEFPDRFINVGVAEQNMIGVAAGLALSGKKVFVYSIANFPTLRCLEQIRNDICYHNLDVTVVAVGGGFAYGSLSYSHHGVEDIAIMRAIPGMTILSPGDPIETRLATRGIVNLKGPFYLRLGKANEPVIHLSDPDFHIGKAIEVRQGNKLTIISTGGMLKSVVEAVDHLSFTDGILISVLSMHTVKPIDKEAIISAARKGPIMTVEEHCVTGGLGSAVAEVIVDFDLKAPLLRFGVPDQQYKEIGSQDYLRNRIQGNLLNVIKEYSLKTNYHNDINNI